MVPQRYCHQGDGWRVQQGPRLLACDTRTLLAFGVAYKLDVASDLDWCCRRDAFARVSDVVADIEHRKRLEVIWSSRTDH